MQANSCTFDVEDAIEVFKEAYMYDDWSERRCALGWLAARLVEYGAELQGREAVLRNGQRLRVYVVPPTPIDGKVPGLAVLIVCSMGHKTIAGSSMTIWLISYSGRINLILPFP